MVRLILLIIISFPLFITSAVNAQDEKIDFNASWKQDSTKATVIVTITKGNPPFAFYVYNDSPFKDGKLLNKTQSINTNIFEVVLNRKVRVFLCLYKDETNYITKWLETSEK